MARAVQAVELIWAPPGPQCMVAPPAQILQRRAGAEQEQL